MRRSLQFLVCLPVLAMLMLEGFCASAQENKQSEFGSSKRKKTTVQPKDGEQDDSKDKNKSVDKDDERGGFGSSRKNKKDDDDKPSREEAKRERELAKLKKSVANRMGKKDDVYIVLSTIEVTFEKAVAPVGNQAGVGANQSRDAIIRGGRVINQGGTGNANPRHQGAGGYQPVFKREVHLIEGRDAAVDHVVEFLSAHLEEDEPAEKRTTRRKRGEPAAQVDATPDSRVDWEFHGAFPQTPQGKEFALARQDQIQKTQKVQDRQRRR